MMWMVGGVAVKTFTTGKGNANIYEKQRKRWDYDEK